MRPEKQAVKGCIVAKYMVLTTRVKAYRKGKIKKSKPSAKQLLFNNITLAISSKISLQTPSRHTKRRHTTNDHFGVTTILEKPNSRTSKF